MRQKALVYFAIFLATAAFAGASVNKSLYVADGETVERSLTSVNGSIAIGSNADLQGMAETVNGGITVDNDARTHDLASVNGKVRVGDRVTVDGDLRSVNGTIGAGDGTIITGGVETVNGSIKLIGTTVHQDLQTVNGHVLLDRGSRVQGDLVIEDSNSRSWERRKPLEIELRDGSVIEGNIEVLDEDLEVTVRLSGGATVMGQVRGAEVIQE
ncbi:MAG: hypothetical protein GY906_33505 [bacterium]|nr:hypothetical protein [bacterium]